MNQTMESGASEEFVSPELDYLTAEADGSIELLSALESVVAEGACVECMRRVHASSACLCYPGVFLERLCGWRGSLGRVESTVDAPSAREFRFSGLHFSRPQSLQHPFLRCRISTRTVPSAL
jgi:hypothetical protein